MHSRRSFLGRLAGLGALAALEVRSASVPATQTRRLEVLLFDRREDWEFFPPELGKALAALGWLEGTNLRIRWNFANGDEALLSTLVATIVRSKPHAILTRGTPVTVALQRATSTVPIVTGLGDPIGGGFARSFAAPGGNITGVSYAVVEASRKRVELLRELVPELATLLVLLPANWTPFSNVLVAPIEAAARDAGLKSQTAVVTNVADLKAALRAGTQRSRIAAHIHTLPNVEPKVIADLALAAGMPTMFEWREYVERGGLASYRIYWDDQTRRTAEQIDKIFRGQSPAQIPFEMPTRSEFVINRTTAKALRLDLSQALLLRADAVVE